MTTASIGTHLDNLHFVPGEVLRGRVSWQAEEKLTAVELRLFYYTAGKGTRDATVVDSLAWTAPPPVGSEEFSFTLPDGPYTFSGKLLSLIWALELVVAPTKHLERLEFVLSPTGHELDLTRYPLPDEIAKPSRAKESFRLEKS